MIIVWDITKSASLSLYPGYDKTPPKRFWRIRYNTIYFEILTRWKKSKSLWLIEHYLPDDILSFLGKSRKITNHQMTKKKYKVNGQIFQISVSLDVKLRRYFFWTYKNRRQGVYTVCSSFNTQYFQRIQLNLFVLIYSKQMHVVIFISKSFWTFRVFCI